MDLGAVHRNGTFWFGKLWNGKLLSMISVVNMYSAMWCYLHLSVIFKIISQFLFRDFKIASKLLFISEPINWQEETLQIVSLILHYCKISRIISQKWDFLANMFLTKYCSRLIQAYTFNLKLCLVVEQLTNQT